MPRLAALAALLLHAAAAHAAPFPPELQDWEGWVRDANPEWTCPVVDGEAACVWPGVLTVDAGTTLGRFSLELHLDRDLGVPLPGGGAAWPQRVLADGRPAVVTDGDGGPTPIRVIVEEDFGGDDGDIGVDAPARPASSPDAEGGPVVHLTAGTHRLTWEVPWPSRPARLALPPTLGTVALTIDGAPVLRPLRDDDGGLSLGADEGARLEGDRLELDVHRRVRDGVPLLVDTVIALRISGGPREEVLGLVGLPGTRPVALSADLPARLTADGALAVQARPGDFRVTLTAVHDGPAARLVAPDPGGAWPDQETWVFVADERARAVQLSGPPGVDPSRTTLPDDWRGHPAYVVTPATPLELTELRRGEPVPPPNQLHLARTLWLDHDGGGWTVQDRFSGAMSEGWRLDAAPPLLLGHLVSAGEDQVITASGDTAGAELRAQWVDVLGEGRIEGAARSLPAVGWQADVASLEATLHLPPGYRLYGATGVDVVSGDVTWNLLELFFVVLVALSVRHLAGGRWALVGLVGLALAQHEAGAPMWTWIVLLVATAIARAVPAGTPARVARAAHLLSFAILLGFLVPFVLGQLRGGLFPVLAEGQDGGFSLGGADLSFASREWEEGAPPTEAMSKMGAPGDSFSMGGRYLTVQKDVAAVVQTGPGVPSWSFHQHTLTWSGPVTADVTMHLFVIGPLGNLLLAALRVGLLLALALRLAELRRLDTGWLTGAAPAAILLLAIAPVARAAPSPDLLGELAERLHPTPACRPACVTVPTASLAIEGERLVVTAEVHAVEASSWPVPGPARAWLPDRVELDGARTAALATLDDGHLHVRVPAGVHTVRASGPLPATGALALQLGLLPRQLDWSAAGWSLLGRKPDGTVEGAVQLVQDAGEAQPATTTRVQPWLEVHRYLDLGLPWRVRTEVRRTGPQDQPLAVRVPLLPGESVLDDALPLQEGAVLVTLDAATASRTWVSGLAQTPTVTLTAPTDVGWSEVWTLSCAPVFRCATDGLPPLAHVRDAVWSPTWRPWPGEQLTVTIDRPPAVEGQTVTIDHAALQWTPGRRSGEANLTLRVRTSQGGQQVVGLPDGARLQGVTADGVGLPVQLRDGAVHLPLHPGSQELAVRWQQSVDPGLIERVPAVDLGGPAVNVSVTVDAPPDRWLLWLGGPRMGPVVLFWLHVGAVLIFAPLLGRLPLTPLRTVSWALLLAGFAHIHVLLATPVVLTLLALGARARRHPGHPAIFILVQLGLAGAVLVSVGCLYAAVHTGLLLDPDMQVSGNGSWNTQFAWFTDRSAATLPQPTIVSLPMWTWRLVMLAWSSWLAWSLVRWARWAWAALSTGGLLRPTPAPEDATPGP